MTVESIKQAVSEANRFLHAAKVALNTQDKYKTVNGIELNTLPNGKANGAVKRASMDLTRALAEMRRP